MPKNSGHTIVRERWQPGTASVPPKDLATRTPELDAMIEEATRRWKAWRVEHPLLTEYEINGLSREQRGARDDARGDALDDLTDDLIPEDKASLLILAGDGRLWAYQTSVAESSIYMMVVAAIDSYICVEVADTLDGARYDLRNAS